MIWLREIPPKWWAVVLGVFFGSLALMAVEGPKKGYSKAIVTGAMTAPFMSILAGALLPEDASLELAAAIGGVTALGGMALIMAVSRFAPTLAIAGLTGMARSFLHITNGDMDRAKVVTRIREDGTPEEPEPKLEHLARKLDEDTTDDD
jgi:hypothetical protein